MITSLEINETDVVSGATAMESCLAVGGAAAFVGAFVSPLGGAVGAVGGCGLGILAFWVSN